MHIVSCVNHKEGLFAWLLLFNWKKSHHDINFVITGGIGGYQDANFVITGGIGGCHDANFVITGGMGGCHDANFVITGGMGGCHDANFVITGGMGGCHDANFVITGGMGGCHDANFVITVMMPTLSSLVALQVAMMPTLSSLVALEDVMMPTLSSLVALEVVMMTTSNATSDDKFIITKTWFSVYPAKEAGAHRSTHAGLLCAVSQGVAQDACIENAVDFGTPSRKTTPRMQNTHKCHKLTWWAGSLHLQFKFELSLFCVGSYICFYASRWTSSIAQAMLFVACTRDGCATFQSPLTSS